MSAENQKSSLTLRRYFVLLLISIGIGAFVSCKSAACERAVKTCDAFVLQNSNIQCRQDHDCEAYFYACAPMCGGSSYVLSKPGVSEEAIPELQKLVAERQRSCSSDSPACTPSGASPKCIQGQCRDEIAKR